MTLLNIALYCSKAETRVSVGGWVGGVGGGGGVQSHFRVKPNYVALFWVVGWVVVLTITWMGDRLVVLFLLVWDRISLTPHYGSRPVKSGQNVITS